LPDPPDIIDINILYW